MRQAAVNWGAYSWRLDLLAAVVGTEAFAPNGTGLAIWVTDPNATFSNGSDNEIAYAVWNGGSWGAPANLTADTVGDRGVDLAYTPNGTAVAAWVHDVGGAGGDYVRTFQAVPAVVGRYIFYNNSAFDGNNTGANLHVLVLVTKS